MDTNFKYNPNLSFDYLQYTFQSYDLVSRLQELSLRIGINVTKTRAAIFILSPTENNYAECN